MKNKTDVYSGSATPDDVRASAAELFANFSDAAKIMPAEWIIGPILDLVTATTFNDPGRRGDTYRRALADMHAALNDAHQRLHRARTATDKPPVPRRVALVG
jgi:hypothetical protein